MGTRTGAKMGAAITEWKMKNRVTSAPARILSKIGFADVRKKRQSHAT